MILICVVVILQTNGQITWHFSSYPQIKTNNTYQKNITSQKGMQEISTKQIDWDDILQCEKKDTNHSFNSFNDAIEKLLDKHLPKRKITKK